MQDLIKEIAIGLIVTAVASIITSFFKRIKSTKIKPLNNVKMLQTKCKIQFYICIAAATIVFLIKTNTVINNELLSTGLTVIFFGSLFFAWCAFSVLNDILDEIETAIDHNLN